MTISDVNPMFRYKTIPNICQRKVAVIISFTFTLKVMVHRIVKLPSLRLDIVRAFSANRWNRKINKIYPVIPTWKSFLSLIFKRSLVTLGYFSSPIPVHGFKCFPESWRLRAFQTFHWFAGTKTRWFSIMGVSCHLHWTWNLVFASWQYSTALHHTAWRCTTISTCWPSRSGPCCCVWYFLLLFTIR